MMCMITPLDTCELFDNQPGLVSHSVLVHKQSIEQYALPVINNTGIRHTVKRRDVLAFIEYVQPYVPRHVQRYVQPHAQRYVHHMHRDMYNHMCRDIKYNLYRDM